MSVTKIPSKLRFEVLDRDKRKCLWCGRDSVDGVILHIDHVLAESFGGETTYDNLGTLCADCNLGKSNSYVGSYLLSTIMKIKEFDKRIHLEKVQNSTLYDGEMFEYSISFYKRPRPNFSYELEKISHQFHINGGLVMCRTPDCEIQKDQIREDALIEFKKKLRDKLVDNEGYLKELNDKIIFKERPRNEKKE